MDLKLMLRDYGRVCFSDFVLVRMWDVCDVCVGMCM